MKLYMIGLGRMGLGMSRRLLSKGHSVVGYDASQQARAQARSSMEVMEDMSHLASEEGKNIWLMVPHEVVDKVLDGLKPYLKEGDTVVDGGNSHYRDSQRRYEELRRLGVSFLDVGVSGGVYGEELGYCLMVGGDRPAFENLEPIFRDLSYEGRGYAYLGPSGAGHFAKMVHNGIEYAFMQAIGEGFELLRESGFGYDLKEVARIYNTGSVIRSWLMDLTQKVFEDFGNLEELKPYVEDTGEGRWTVEEAIKRAVPVPTIAEALFARFRSRQENSFRDRLLAGLRYQFGRHQVKKRDG
ncbi:MAG: phosphogluconate dehydrogenase (NAD(+)-dependent, decarboxylating) [Aquificaceae bacterium]|jgi:6-phosphogluconate dehydrogenase|uniref:phosphogluconate dehydrogenase (NAD(+)-dependent, decarboxylating) n=1 Tax=Hydrogenobacter sp. Uz 6-8 TaxID=3384828 RepID=UPI000F19727D|nr:MAG: decarboxylating 6-phosphogluconate dehydrogenase [Aquificota bacterium]